MLTKYPSTPYHYLTPGRDPNDKVLNTNEHFLGKTVIITEKMDGESFTGYSTGQTHARSLDSQHHFTRDWVKQYWASRGFILPPLWRVCGENVWAQHSITYDDLETFFYGYSVWDDQNYCLDWTKTLKVFFDLDIEPVPTLYCGVYSDDIIKEVWASLDLNKQEGIVIRLESGYNYDDFSKSICKLVRPNHVQEYVDPISGEAKHWKYAQIQPNKLKGQQ